MRELSVVEPARLDPAAQAWFDEAAAVITRNSRYRVADGHTAGVATLVGERLALDPDWTVLPLRSGTDALLIRALRVAGVTPGAEVIIPDLAFHAVGASVLEIGAVPVSVDVDPADWNLDATCVEAALGSSTACVVAVDNYGTPVDLRALSTLTRAAGVPLVLDACESLGAAPTDRGATPDLIVTSFSFTKPVHAAGMGGALCGPAATVEEAAVSPHLLGPQLRLPELNAAYLVAAWPSLDANLARLRAIHESYAATAVPLGCTAQGGASSSTRLHPALLAPDARARDRIVADLAGRGIPARDYFPSQARLLGLGLPPPVSAEVTDRVFCLPGGAGLGDADRNRVVDALGHALSA